MQPKITVRIESAKRETKMNKPNVLQKVAQKIRALAPIRSNIPIPPPISSSSSLSLTFTSERLSSSPQSPSFPFSNYHPTSTFPVPYALPSPALVPPAPAVATPTSSIHRRRGAIIELPNEWYAKGEQYNSPAFARTQSKEHVGAEPIRRAKSYQPPPPPTQSIRSIGLSVLGGVRRGKSAQAALCVGPAPAPNAARVEEHERHQDVLDWRESLGLSDEIAFSFDFEEDLDQVFEGL